MGRRSRKNPMIDLATSHQAGLLRQIIIGGAIIPLYRPCSAPLSSI
jgi:hypothetical protein